VGGSPIRPGYTQADRHLHPENRSVAGTHASSAAGLASLQYNKRNARCAQSGYGATPNPSVEKIQNKLQAFNERFAVRLSLTTLHEADWYRSPSSVNW
jgi:hypothetical protein